MPRGGSPAPRHGTTERYRRCRCRCHPCVRAWTVYRHVVADWPAVRDPVPRLTDPCGPAFWRLVALIPPHVRAACRRRAEERWAREQAAAPSRAGAEISHMTPGQIEALMHPDIPAPAQTRRRTHARWVA